MKSSYLAKDICTAFEIPTRTFQYWMEQKFVIPDIHDRQPRIYSIHEALVTGLIEYFITKGGYTPQRAARIGRLSLNAALHIQGKEGNSIQCPGVDNYTLKIFEGVLGVMESQKENKVAFLSSITAYEEDERKTLQNLDYTVLHEYKFSKIIDSLLFKLGIKNDEEILIKQCPHIVIFYSDKELPFVGLDTDPSKSAN
ncbi:hypothetical protein [Desulfovibrio porci]|uniref:hypothetical protein n=1 Tax=Desulfovibrio porci TaxID=2605782 RepID=UPI002A8021BB|nr:hypothetical protein [Desulfovibrio porci]MDY3811008.1 hypothetical protein [Desulfovibrio porci]